MPPWRVRLLRSSCSAGIFDSPLGESAASSCVAAPSGTKELALELRGGASSPAGETVTGPCSLAETVTRFLRSRPRPARGQRARSVALVPRLRNPSSRSPRDRAGARVRGRRVEGGAGRSWRAGLTVRAGDEARGDRCLLLPAFRTVASKETTFFSARKPTPRGACARRHTESGRPTPTSGSAATAAPPGRQQACGDRRREGDSNQTRPPLFDSIGGGFRWRADK